MAKKQKQVRVTNVRISSDKPRATVKFKDVTKKGSDTTVVRATMRGEKPLFIKGADGTWTAGVRGDSPVAAKSPDQAFAKGVRQNWA